MCANWTRWFQQNKKCTTFALFAFQWGVSFFAIASGSRDSLFVTYLSQLHHYNRVFSLTWLAYMQIYWNKRKRLHKKRVQLPQDPFGTPTWPPFHCFGAPIWPPWSHVKTLYKTPNFRLILPTYFRYPVFVKLIYLNSECWI